MSVMSAVTQKLASSTRTGVVISAGKMNKAVKVRIAGQEWNKAVRKFFPSSKTYLVSDPTSSLREGDVVRIASGWRASKNIRHVVSSIVAPFGDPINERAPIMTEEQRLAEREKERIAKDVRQAARGRRPALLRLKEWKEMGKEIPDLETAMAKVRVAEGAEEAKEQAGQPKGQQVVAKKVDAVVEEKTDAKPKHQSGRRKKALAQKALEAEGSS